MADEQFDLIVVGGGPGGSTVATLVAMRGYKVLLLEQEELPRYQIGESTLPYTLGICKILGVGDDLARRVSHRNSGACGVGAREGT